jgi:nitrate reductase (cytochrome), electron transfer subunit
MRAIVVLAIALCAGCANSTAGPASAPAAGGAAAAAPTIPDTSVGLARGSVFDVPSPPAVKPNETAPGEGPVLPRPYTLAPPRVPHTVGDFLPITPKQNACVDCHAVADKKKGEPTPMPASHYRDYRNAPDVVGSRVAGARWVCVSCHATATDAPDLVGNRFKP